MIIKTLINGSPFEIEIADDLHADVQFEEGRVVLRKTASSSPGKMYREYLENAKRAMDSRPITEPNSLYNHYLIPFGGQPVNIPSVWHPDCLDPSTSVVIYDSVT